MLIPVQPSPYDIWGTSDVCELVKQRQQITEGAPLAAFVISRRIARTHLSEEIHAALADDGFPIFKAGTSQRVMFAQSAAVGTTVLDLEPNGPAAAEILAITKELKEFVK